LYSAFGTRQVADIFRPFNDYKVLLEVGPKFRETSTDLQNIYLRNASGTPVSMNTFASVAAAAGPLTINHQPSASLHDHLVQSRARHRARRGRQPDRRAAAPGAPARHRVDELPGQRPGVRSRSPARAPCCC
jgi:hypothetical protein